MKTKQDLDKATEDFFKIHWNSDVIKLNKTWNWEWVEYDLIGTMCNHDKQGCYAFFKDQKIVYVGLGAGRGSGIYKGAGLGARINQHLHWEKETKRDDLKRTYAFNHNWKGKANRIFTIGCPEKFGYIALSLEAYLIHTLDPQYNLQKPGSS